MIYILGNPKHKYLIMGASPKKRGLAILHLIQTGDNQFEDVETKTSFTFLMAPLTLKEAERRAEAQMKLYANAGRLERFYGRHHTVLATGKLPGHPGLSC